MDYIVKNDRTMFVFNEKKLMELGINEYKRTDEIEGKLISVIINFFLSNKDLYFSDMEHQILKYLHYEQLKEKKYTVQLTDEIIFFKFKLDYSNFIDILHVIKQKLNFTIKIRTRRVTSFITIFPIKYFRNNTNNKNISVCFSEIIYRDKEIITEEPVIIKKAGTVYKFINIEDEVVYVGKTKGNVHERIYSHSKNGHLPKQCYECVNKIEYIETVSKADMDILELYFINKYKPIFNKKSKTEDSLFLKIDEKSLNWKSFMHHF